MTIIQYLNDKGYKTAPAEFYGKIKQWKSWYDGKVKGFHDYMVSTGQGGKVECERFSMGMAKKVCEDWANLLMNEKVQITLEGKKEQEFWDDFCTKVNFDVRISEMQELKSCYGTTAYIPRIVGAAIDSDTGTLTGEADGIKMDYVTGDRIYPITWENREITECAFASHVYTDDQDYAYVQIHHLVDGKYRIENALLKLDKESVTEIDMHSIRGFENVPKTVETGSDKRLFVIDRLNIVNNYDNTLPLGIAVYANAIDQLKACDIAYDSYVNEFVLGKKRIMVKPEAVKNIDGNPYFDPNDVTFYVLPEDSDPSSIIHETNMEIRAAAHNAGMQDMLNVLSSRCGFGENHYRYDNGSVSTATQIISQNSEMFRTIKKHEIILRSVLTELTRTVVRLGNTYMDAGLDENVQISIDFDDSIIEDKETEFNRDARMVQMGIMQPYEFRMKHMNEDEATAKAALPKMESLVSGENE